VEFCCPGCGQVHLGDNAKGQPEPAAFNCSQCGIAISLNDVVIRPVDPQVQALTIPSINPWVFEREQSRLKTFAKTCYLGICHPLKLLGGTPHGLDHGGATIFGVLILLVLLACKTIGVAINPWVNQALYGDANYSTAALPVMAITMQTMLLGLFALFATLVAHGVLLITGQVRGTLSDTFKAIAYTSPILIVADVLNWFMPPVGIVSFALLGHLAWVITFSMGLRGIHRVSIARALFASVTLPMLLTLCGFGILMMLFSQIGPC
jgi:hypothetical protein